MTDRSIGSGNADQARDSEPVDNLVIGFDHRVFNDFEDAFFRIPHPGAEPVFVVPIGDIEYVLGFPGILKEFKIANGSPDARMLEVVADGLNFVKFLQVGDPVPSEIVTREASWDITDEHRRAAYQRLTMQLVGWISGREKLITVAADLEQIAADPGTRAKVSEAFSKASEQLGFGVEGQQQVLQLIEDLANDLAYLEALRDLFQKVRMMERKIQGLRRLYSNRRSVWEIADPVARLITTGIREYSKMFAEADAQTAEIMGMLKNIDKQTEFIRNLRDDLYCRLMAWDEMFTAWEPIEMTRSEGDPDLLRETYRFLAPRFMQMDEWVLMTQLDRDAPEKSPKRRTPRNLTRGVMRGSSHRRPMPKIGRRSASADCTATRPGTTISRAV